MANATKVPYYIYKEFMALNNALGDVAKHAQKITDWVDERTDYEGSDFFNEYQLDNAYEFNARDAYHALWDMVQGQEQD